ncbi:unnamed protein product [Diatraea saccharalis]|uniref:Peptidase S1 domain-containing protein n=1 Tax=Diatraea saccharalis TaxID=40085 RepID=A0A9N9N0L1_9NEOP|nr:unnamed protein product [Diatraea saccharalis]
MFVHPSGGDVSVGPDAGGGVLCAPVPGTARRWRCVQFVTEAEQAAAYHVGMVYVGGGGGGSEGRRCVCGCVVVRARWSAAPARCVAARTHPALATLLPSWSARVTDRTGRHIETSIIRSVVHSHFNRDDSLNDIGLFQHKDSIDIENYHYGMLWRARASPVSREVCRHHVAPVMELRDHELCVTLDTTPPQALLGVGAALVVDSYVIGFYSWGSERGDLPLIILNMAHYQRWIENIVN